MPGSVIVRRGRSTASDGTTGASFGVELHRDVLVAPDEVLALALRAEG